MWGLEAFQSFIVLFKFGQLYKIPCLTRLYTCSFSSTNTYDLAFVEIKVLGQGLGVDFTFAL